MKKSLLLVFVLYAVPGLFGQPPAPSVERFLVPIVIDADAPVPGAFGSLWRSTLFFRNDTSEPVSLLPHPSGCTLLCLGDVLVPPERTVELSVSAVRGPAVLLSLQRRSPGQVSFNLRIHDLSRESQTWGTEIPIVPEREFRTSRLVLVGIPLRSGFRHTLRIYELSQRSTETFVRLRVVGTKALPRFWIPPAPPVDSLLGEIVLRLAPPLPGAHLESPGFAQLHDLAKIGSLAGWDLVTLEIEPLTEGMRYWAFVTVTNNETQHVTTITPQ